MRLLVIVKNTPSSSSSAISKRRRSSKSRAASRSVVSVSVPAQQAGRFVFPPRCPSATPSSSSSSAAFALKTTPRGRCSRRHQAPSRKVVLLSPRATAFTKKMSRHSISDNSIPDWLMASFPSSPFVSVPAAPHNTSDYLIRIHSSPNHHHHDDDSSSSAAIAAENRAMTGDGLIDDSRIGTCPTSSSSCTSDDSFDYLDTFGSNFGFINPTNIHFKPFPQHNRDDASSSGMGMSPINMVPVEAR